MKWLYMSYGIEGSRNGSNDNILKMVKRPFVEEGPSSRELLNTAGSNKDEKDM
jgi:hypothetical protein